MEQFPNGVFLVLRWQEAQEQLDSALLPTTQRVLVVGEHLAVLWGLLNGCGNLFPCASVSNDFKQFVGHGRLFHCWNLLKARDGKPCEVAWFNPYLWKA